MLSYSIKRALRSILTLCIIITIVFVMLRQMPIEGYFNDYDNMSPDAVQNGLEAMGLLDPIPEQLANFFGDLLQGDLGTSNRYRVNYPINEIVAQKIPISLTFGGLSMLIGIPLGLLLGGLMARGKGKLWDGIGTGYIVLIQAVPLAVYYLFIQLYGTEFFGIPLLYSEYNLATRILPTLSLAMPTIATYAMWLRRYMVDETNRDYIKLARAKGTSNSEIWFKHVFRNAAVPLVQLIPASILATVSGSIYIESLYSIPGMGGLLVDVIKRQDNSMVQALVIIFALLSMLGLLLGDILMGLVDPRIAFNKKEGAR